MAVAEIGTNTLRGRREHPLEARAVGPILESDLALLASERGIKPHGIKALRDRHHALAQCLANGMRDAEASAITGYCISRIAILRGDPTFAQLVSEYRTVKDGVFADFQTRAAAAAIEAINLIHDKLESDPDAISLEQGLAVIQTLADRTGHAPVAKSLNVNANVNFGDRLAAARQRVQSAVPPSASRDRVPPPGRAFGEPLPDLEIEGEIVEVLEAAE